MEYIYNFAGMLIEIKVPFEIIIRKESKEFMFLKKDGENRVDFILELQEEIYLEKLNLPEKGQWYDFSFYSEIDQYRTMYLCVTRETRPYARCVMDLKKSNEIKCFFDPAQWERLKYSKNICEILRFEEILKERSGIWFHSSHVRYKGKGILFFGPSGIGKSTQANLWTEFEDADIINGDKTALRKLEDGWYGYGLPFAGSSDLFRNEFSEIKVLVALEKGVENRISKISVKEALVRIYAQTAVHTWDQDYIDAITDILLQLISEVPVYLLSCRPDRGAVELLKRTVFAEK